MNCCREGLVADLVWREVNVMTGLFVECEHQYESGATVACRFATESLITALVGPSGCGKSTVLHIIAGLVKPAVGTVKVGQQTMMCTRTGKFVSPHNRRIGMAFQQRHLFPHMTVRGNLLYGQKRSKQGTIPKLCQSRIGFDEVVELLEVQTLLDRLPAELSGGQQQRVAVGRALLSQPSLLLLDEPFVALDAELLSRLVPSLKQLIERCQIPTILVAHDQSQVASLTNTIIDLTNGG